MSKLLSAQALSWVRQSAATGCVTSQVLANLMERVEALEARPQPPAPRPTHLAPVAAHPNHEGSEYADQEWAEVNRWRQESSDLQPTPPAAPAGFLVEMVVAATRIAEELAGEKYERAAIARVAIRYVAMWLDLQGQHGCSLLLRKEVDQ